MGTIIYTCITNGYDQLNDIKTIHKAICFTDMDIQSDTWEIIKIKDHDKLNRKIKICPHLFLPAHTRNIWIDGNAKTENIDNLIEGKTGFWVMKHPDRTCAYVEGIHCIEQGKDTEEKIMCQLNKYYSEGFPIDFGLVCGGLLIRDNSVKNRKFGTYWWKEVNDHSIRDQISFPYVAWKINFDYDTMSFQKDRYELKHHVHITELKELLKVKNFDLSDSILISSSPGSGSTWLMKLLKVVPGTLINWDPLHPQLGAIQSDLNLENCLIVPEEDQKPGSSFMIEEILTLKKHTDYTLKYCSSKDVKRGSMVITKLTGSNLLLPWLVKNRSFKHKPIYLIRHPIAAVMSQMNGTITDNKTSTDCAGLDWMKNKLLSSHFSFVSMLETELEKKIALWCVNNMNIINHPDNGIKWLTVYYEGLLLQPIKEFKRILNELNLNLREHTINTINYQRESSHYFVDVLENEPLRQLEKWTLKLDQQELAKIQTIFDYFGLKIYSAYSALPLNSALS
jgi:hypothetical protein